MSATTARLKHFGWSREGEGLSADEEAFVLARAAARFGTALKPGAQAPRRSGFGLPPPLLAAPTR
jgi:alkyldihydroxyacetonephosphate synthase